MAQGLDIIGFHRKTPLATHEPRLGVMQFACISRRRSAIGTRVVGCLAQQFGTAEVIPQEPWWPVPEYGLSRERREADLGVRSGPCVGGGAVQHHEGDVVPELFPIDDHEEAAPATAL